MEHAVILRLPSGHGPVEVEVQTADLPGTLSALLSVLRAPAPEIAAVNGHTLTELVPPVNGPTNGRTSTGPRQRTTYAPICPQCHTRFETTDKRQHYCSRACVAQARAKKAKPAAEEEGDSP